MLCYRSIRQHDVAPRMITDRREWCKHYRACRIRTHDASFWKARTHDHKRAGSVDDEQRTTTSRRADGQTSRRADEQTVHAAYV
jgi:hypothetical protein